MIDKEKDLRDLWEILARERDSVPIVVIRSTQTQDTLRDLIQIIKREQAEEAALKEN